jgi:hypothetical protein
MLGLFEGFAPPKVVELNAEDPDKTGTPDFDPSGFRSHSLTAFIGGQNDS